MAVQAWFSTGDVDVAPGATTVLHATIVNLGDITETFALAPAGMAAGWTTVRPATVTLFGGSQENIDVVVSPPLLPSTTAGPTALSVRIVPQSDPDDVTSAETTLNIGTSQDRRLYVLQPALRGRRRANYELMLENQGNTQASCRLRLVDPSGRVDGDFDPPAAGVEPGASTLIRLKLRSNRRQWERRSRTLAFTVEADQPGSPTAVAPATFVQAPMVPERLLGRAAAVALGIAALFGVWFGLVKPAIKDAARDAVADERPATVTTIVGTVTTQAPDDTTPVVDDTVPVVAEPSLYDNRMIANAPAGQTLTSTFTVPEGQVLRITDLILQNPEGDQGTATLLRDDAIIGNWRLDVIFGEQQTALRTPIEVKGGQTVTYQVVCTGTVPGAATCTAALQILGTFTGES